MFSNYRLLPNNLEVLDESPIWIHTSYLVRVCIDTAFYIWEKKTVKVCIIHCPFTGRVTSAHFCLFSLNTSISVFIRHLHAYGDKVLVFYHSLWMRDHYFFFQPVNIVPWANKVSLNYNTYIAAPYWNKNMMFLNRITNFLPPPSSGPFHLIATIFFTEFLDWGCIS